MRSLTTIVFLIAFLFTSCQPKVEGEGPWVKKIDSEELSRLVIYFSKKMETENHLFLEDSYATYDESIEQIVLKYSSQRLLTFCEARLLIVELVEEFLYRLNNNTVLGFEVEEFPFTAKHLDVRINFESYYGKYSDEQYIGLIWLQNGCVNYFSFERKDLNSDCDSHRIEPYFKSRELALIKKEADMPYTELNPPKKPSSFIYDRYLP